MVPREDFIILPLSVGIKGRVDTAFLKCLHPLIEFIVFAPAVKLTALFPCGIDNVGKPSVAPCKNCLKNSKAIPYDTDLPTGDSVACFNENKKKTMTKQMIARGTIKDNSPIM